MAEPATPYEMISIDQTDRIRVILAALGEAAEFQRRIFGDRFVAVTAAEVIEEARREQTEKIG